MTLNSLGAEEKDRKSSASILIEPGELQEKLKTGKLRVLDARSQAAYSKSHVPGALRVDVNDWKNLALSDGGFTNAKAWSAKVGALGIDNETHVVVYSDKVSSAARIWWLLKYAGLKNASLLNGGWELWMKQQRPVDAQAPSVAEARFKPSFEADRLAEQDSVAKSLKVENVKVVDTRSDAEFAAGRIPNAVHLEWKHLLEDDGRFKSKTELKDIFLKQGVLLTDTAVCY